MRNRPAVLRRPGAALGFLLPGLLGPALLGLGLLGSGLVGCASPAPAVDAADAADAAGSDLVLAVPRLEERALLLLMVDRQLFEPMVVDRLVVSPDPRLREELAAALGQVGDPRGRTWLAQLLADRDAEVRRAAAFALGELDYGGDPAAGGEISAERREAARGLLVAVADPDRETGLLAVEALGKVGVSVVDVLAALTRSELPEAERWARLLPPLFRFDEPAAVPVAEGALGLVTDPELHRRAAYALARSPRPEALPRLRELLADPDPRVRAWAARALGIVGDASDLGRLAVLLGGRPMMEGGPGEAASGAGAGAGASASAGAGAGAGTGAGAGGGAAAAGTGADATAEAGPAIQALRAGAALAAAAVAASAGSGGAAAEVEAGSVEGGAVEADSTEADSVEGGSVEDGSSEGDPVETALAVPPAVAEAWRQHLVRLASDPRRHVRLEALDTAGTWAGLDGRPAGGDDLAALLVARAEDTAAPADERAAALLALAGGGDPRAARLATAFAAAATAALPTAAPPGAAPPAAATATAAPTAAEQPVDAPSGAGRSDAAAADRDARLLAAAAAQAAALLAAGQSSGTGEPMAALRDRMLADERPAVRTAAAGAALAAAEEDAAAALAADLLVRDPDAGVRGTVFGWLADHPVLPYVELTRAVQATLEAGNVEASLAGVDALAARAGAAAGERGSVVTVLEKLAARRAAGPNDWLLRRRAAAALAELGRPAPPVAPPVDRPPGYYQRVLQRTAAAREVEMVTEAGTLRLRLDCPRAPLTCLSFLNLAAQGYFDGQTFHRVVPDFVVQAGDPRGDGLGGPGYAIRDEINRLRYERGTLGMALAGPDTGGSQFFLTLSPQPHLDGGYTAFGRVVGGDEVLDEIGRGTRILSVRERR